MSKPLYIPLLPYASFTACVDLVKEANKRQRTVCGYIHGDLVTANPGDDSHDVFCDAGWYPCDRPQCLARKASRVEARK